MTTQDSAHNSAHWWLDGTQATLQTPQLSAVLDLRNPHAGISQLAYGDRSLDGFVLGVTPGACPLMSGDDITDVFVRGNDLVVNYEETETRPFSLQVYWRSTTAEDGVILLDTILSLQTDLLESFPGLAVETKIAASTAFSMTGDAEASQELTLKTGQRHCWLAESSDGVLLRPCDASWSYAEITHPDDRSDGWLDSVGPDAIHSHRQLGGSFLEKGVIRRLRVRGVFLPRDNDLEIAAQSLCGLANEQPPLTV